MTYLFKRLLLLGGAVLALGGSHLAMSADTWYDGEQLRVLHEDTELQARLEFDVLNADATKKQSIEIRSPLSVRLLSPSSVQSEKLGGEQPGVMFVPVYRDQPRGAVRVAVGGVIVRWAEGVDAAQQAAWLSAQGLQVINAPENAGWVLVASQPGRPSVHLARVLHQSEEVLSASPNWWRPTSAR